MGKNYRNQIVITSLALLIAVVGYISYDNSNLLGSLQKDKKVSDSTQVAAVDDSVIATEEVEGTEEILNAGETVLTSTVTQNQNYVAEVKLNREQVRSKSKNSLQEIIDNEQLSEQEKKSAVDGMVKISKIEQMETDAEMLLKAKGFDDVVVSISEGCCDVVVDKENVTDEKRAQIEDIINRKTEIKTENIVITTID